MHQGVLCWLHRLQHVLSVLRSQHLFHVRGRTLESGLDDVKRMKSKRRYQARRQSSREFY